MKERWLVRILVDRDPETETIPRMWEWDELLQGGSPTVLMCTHVGYSGDTEDDIVTCCICDTTMSVDDITDGHKTRNHNRPERKALPCHVECVPKERHDYR